jgi:catechol 2,3-dioxygenase-like lactoylglutathione lyase family enzyme
VKRLAALLIFSSLFAAAQTTDAPKRPHILGISHMALFVSDLAKSRAFYEDFLGYDEAYVLKRDDGSIHIAFIKINENEYIELFTDPPKQDGHMSHIAFFTDDVEGLRAYLAAQGVKVPAQAGKGKIGNTEFNVTDPDGHTVEFVQYQPDSLTRREAGQHIPETRISTHIPHIGVTIRHLDAAQKFYGGILGFQEFWRGSSDGKTLSWVNMRVPDGGDTGDYLELMLYSDPQNGTELGGKNHICLVTPDIVKAVAALNARPARKDYPRPIEIKVGKNGKRQANLFDPDGTRIELMEPGTADGNPVPPSTAPPPQ